jgi:putative lipoprotein
MNPLRVLIAILLLVVTACDVNKPEISGDVIQLDDGSLPISAVITVDLQDVSLADAPASVLATNIIDEGRQLPVFYFLEYDPDDFVDGNTYVVSARIEDDGQLLYVTDTANVVDFDDIVNEDVGIEMDIVVVPVNN